MTSTNRDALRILLVEDDNIQRALATFLLQQLEHDVTPALDGTEALAKLSAATFDIVLTDMNMPDMTGTDLLQAMRERHGLGQIPVIIASAGPVNEIEQNDTVHYLRKPITIESLRDVLRHSVEVI